MFRQICTAFLKRIAPQSMTSVRKLMSPALAQQVALEQLDGCGEPPTRGIIFGVYADPNDKFDAGILTDAAWKYNIDKTKGRLLDVLRMSGPIPKPGEARLFFGIEPVKHPTYSVVAIVGLGKECLGYNPYEVIDEQKEAIRCSVGKAAMALAKLSTMRIDVESMGHAESAAEGMQLGIWAYQELREKHNRIMVPHIDLYVAPDAPCDLEGWRIGIQKAAAQNFTRQLQEMPSNLLTPTSFAQNVVDFLCKSGVNVELKVDGWAEAQSMHAFRAVGRASCEQPIFMELSYFGTCPEVQPIVLVGQGITYDTGGLNLKEKKELYNMRADMTGAAVVVSTCRAIADMRLPLNIRGLIPLCENMLGCNAFRPGDVVKAMNGKHMTIEGTNHEDVLVLADALLYAQNFCPKFIVDIGTCSGYMRNALDEAACGVFTNSEMLWQQIKHASMHTGDRVWRMPLWNYYKQNIKCRRTDLRNYGAGRGGRPCKAAAFLSQFVPCGQWMHIDATNVMVTNGEHFEYLRKGMAGRPTRTIVEFLAETLCSNVAPKNPPGATM